MQNFFFFYNLWGIHVVGSQWSIEVKDSRWPWNSRHTWSEAQNFQWSTERTKRFDDFCKINGDDFVWLTPETLGIILAQ